MALSTLSTNQIKHVFSTELFRLRSANASLVESIPLDEVKENESGKTEQTPDSNSLNFKFEVATQEDEESFKYSLGAEHILSNTPNIYVHYTEDVDLRNLPLNSFIRNLSAPVHAMNGIKEIANYEKRGSEEGKKPVNSVLIADENLPIAQALRDYNSTHPNELHRGVIEVDPSGK